MANASAACVDVIASCWNDAIESAKRLPGHSKGILRMVAEGEPLASVAGHEDEEDYKRAFNTLLKAGFIEFDGWLPALTAKGQFAYQHGVKR